MDSSKQCPSSRKHAVVQYGLAAIACFAVGSGDALAGSGAGAPKPAAYHAMVAPEPDSTRSMSSDWAWHGERLSDLAVRWYHWFEAIPAGVVPHGDPSGANCGIGQSGPVWFLSGPLGGSFVNACTVPAGKLIMSPVFNVIDDYPCPADFKFEPSPGQGLEAFLKTDIANYIDTGYTIALFDGRPLRVHRVRTPLFGFTAAASNVAGDPCITGSPQLAVSEGYYVFIDPPSRGRHTLQLRSGTNVFTPKIPTDVTIHLTVK